MFTVITDRLEVLKQKAPGNEASVERAIAVLDSLASVKSCMIVVGLGDEKIVPFFTALLKAIQLVQGFSFGYAPRSASPSAPSFTGLIHHASLKNLFLMR